MWLALRILAAVNHSLCVSRARARGRPLGQRFRSGGAGAELWGLFGASRSKPLAEGLAVACVRSGISGWVIGLLSRVRAPNDAVARLVGIEGGVVSGVFNLESSGVRASDWRPRHDKRYHEA